ncbi:ATP phosphoribosyltransferase regulatory subunit [soil metagenome]
MSALAAVRAPFERFGAERGGAWCEPPVLQPLSLLLDLAGEGLRSRLHVLNGGAGEEQALRPDFTIALARLHIADVAPSPAVHLYDGMAFRVPAEGSTRRSEFRQVGVEVFGNGHDPAVEDGRIAALAWEAASAGGRSDLSLVFGDVALFAAFLQAVGAPDAARARLVKALASGRSVPAELKRLRTDDPSSGGGGAGLARLLVDLPEAEAVSALEELWRLAGIQPVGGRGASEIVHRLLERAQDARTPRLGPEEASLVERYLQIDAAPEAALDRVQSLARDGGGGVDAVLEGWRRRLTALGEAGVQADRITLQTGFARAFGYYDGAFFEVRSASLPSDAPVAAGGRSDGLIARLGGEPTLSVGCMVRPDRASEGAGA